MEDQDNSPINPIPPVIAVLFLIIVGVEGIIAMGGLGIIGGPQAIGWRMLSVQQFGFSSDVFQWMIATGQYPLEQLMRFVTYPFIHGNFMHALFVGVMLLAIGKFVGEVLSQLATLLVFFAGIIAGALAHGFVMHDQPWLIGGFPGVYALIGAFTYLLYVRLVSSGASGARAFSLIGFLMAIRLLFGLLFGSDSTWLADLVGFVAGFAVTVIAVPGGWSRLRYRMRRQ